ncbi:MAG TPA: glycosyltransferase, partial [Dehalococcoidia bacterium]|nr:glycosyltransferase [Dehalococcoidia bacterium]
MADTDTSLSVIIPTYNRAETVGRAIQSVLDQTYQDFEIVVVDDGSKDNTEEVVKSFNDKRVKYIKHERNEGVAAARNTGIKATRRKYIAFQDSDDEWLPEKLEKQMVCFRTASSNIGVVYTAFLRVEGDKKTYVPSPEVIQKEGDIYDSLLRGNFVATPAAVVKRECFAKVGMFDEDIPCLEDWELWLRISKHYHFRCIDEPLVIAYSATAGSLIANQDAVARGYELVFKKYYGGIKKKGRRLLASYYINVGDSLSLSGEFKRG